MYFQARVSKFGLIAGTLFAGSLLAGEAFAQSQAPGEKPKPAQSGAQSAQSKPINAGPQQASQMIQDWPETARSAAKAMLDKYGAPDEATPTRLIWFDTGPWKRTIVYKEEIEHNFPMPHKDVLEQVVNYEVPADKFDELARFDGSVIVDRTRGEIAARCDKEAANFLALNLAHDVVTDKRSVEEARDFYAKTMKAMMQGEKPEYTSKLLFKPAGKAAGFEDEAMMKK